MDCSAEPGNLHFSDLLESWPPQQSDESNIRFILWASFAEIYNENIYDLLETSSVATARSTRPVTLQLRDGDGRPYICGLREIHVSTAEETWQLLQIGRKNQHIAATSLNRTSSRSHSIFTLRLIQVVDVDQPKFARVASLSFCDLAGSERNSAAGGCNERVKEAGNINLSLMTLGRCIDALRKKQARRDQSVAATTSRMSSVSSTVPFRNSKLTRLFQSFLCGEGRVVMITNVSPCANVFDETLHAVNYSALATQVVVGPLIPQPSSVLAAISDKHRISVLGKHEAAVSKAGSKKRKYGSTAQEAKTKDGERPDKHPTLPEEDEETDEDVSESWNVERQKLLVAIDKLQNALADEQQLKMEQETQIRKEVCTEMQKQLVQIESNHQENVRRREEILEEKYDRKMEIFKEAVQKSCKRQRRDENDDEYIPSIELHAAQVKLSNYQAEVSELKSRNAEVEKQLTEVRESVGKVSAERDALAEKLTKAEFSANETSRRDRAQARAECAQLQETVKDLTNKLSDAEHRHEVSCRQLRRDKAQLEQKLNAAGSSNQNECQEAKVVDVEVDTDGRITALEADLKKERDTVIELESRMKLAEDITKAVEKSCAEQCKEVNSLYQEKSYELTKLGEKYSALEHSIQERVKTLEETEQKLREKLKQTEDERAATVDQLNIEIAKRAAQLLETTDELSGRVSDIGHLEKNLEAERHSRCELEAKLADCEKKLAAVELDLSQESAKCSTLQSSLEALQTELDETKEAQKSVKGEIADHLSAVGSYEAKLESVNMELQKAEEQRAKLESALSDARLNEGLVGQMKSTIAENEKTIGQLEKDLEVERNNRSQSEAALADCERKCVELKSDLSRETEKYLTLQLLFEAAEIQLSEVKNSLKTAEEESAGHEGVVEQMKLTITEQEITMQTQDQKLRECDTEVQSLNERLSQLTADHNELESLTDEIRQKDAKIEELETTVLTQDRTLVKCDKEVDSLKAKLVQATEDRNQQVESFNNEIRQKSSRIRDLEKEVEQAEKSRECLKKDVVDVTSELKATEHNLAEVKKELAQSKQELENIRSDAVSAKSSVKELYQREQELSGLRKQVEVEQDKCQKLEREVEKLKSSKEKELSSWRAERDLLATKLENSISEKDKVMNI